MFASSLLAAENALDALRFNQDFLHPGGVLRAAQIHIRCAAASAIVSEVAITACRKRFSQRNLARGADLFEIPAARLRIHKINFARAHFQHILKYMKTLIVELDDETAARLEQVAPGRARRRSEFIRNAVRKALWEIEEQSTAQAYRRQPDSADDAYLNPAVWEPRTKSRRTRTRARR